MEKIWVDCLDEFSDMKNYKIILKLLLGGTFNNFSEKHHTGSP
jgi:hypothetical protein